MSETAESDTDKRLFIGLGTPLQIEIEGIKLRLKSTLVGMESDDYFIITTPSFPREFGTIKQKLIPGIQVVARYMHEGTVFGFRTKLIEAFFSPRRLLFLEYPKKIERNDIRSNKRVDCIIPAKIIIKDKETQGTILDINEKGCRLRYLYLSKKVGDNKWLSAEIEDQITLWCHFPGIQGDQVLLGIIKNIQKDSQGIVLGIQFQEMADDIKNVITNYTSTINNYL